MASDSKENTHAFLSPSSSHRWLNCTLAPHYERLFPSETSEYADAGTALHQQAADFLTGKTKEKPEDIELYINYIENLRSQEKFFFELVEKKIDLSNIIVQDGGTVDYCCLIDDCLYVCDLKTGYNPVEAEENPQLLIYAGGLMQLYGDILMINKIKLIIIQKMAGGVTEWQCSAEELQERIDYISKKAIIAFYGHFAEAKAGEWCRYCRAAGKCRVNSQLVAPVQDCNMLTISNDELLKLLNKVDDVRSTCNAIEKEAFTRVSAGAKIGDWAIVQKRGRRKIIKPDELEVFLRSKGFSVDEFTEQKLKTLGAIEKLLGKEKKEINQFCEVSDAGLKLEKIKNIGQDCPFEKGE